MSAREPELLSRVEVMALVGVGYSKFRQLLEDGTIPPGLGLGPRSQRWDKAKLIAHLEARVSAQKVARAA